ncbi:TetR/AcrR family transcriptional regulator [Acidobacterium sp. S8]|uniref:TetR/AcrR family transcriptional regulator n=1 Tax=Acidobacterium sp. S8 TaxID=1641854 RepID=UPI00131C1DA4|nr:TetR/AcrR family transcriptional regulator [Acidobacterium sp. S8]
MKKAKVLPCKRPYSLGKRLELSDKKKARILAAARLLLEKDGFLALTLEILAGESGVTRQTVHNLFGSKTGVLEALFDQIAFSSGMEQMRNVMQQPDPDTMLDGFIGVFSAFWTKNRLLFRRIHGIAAIDPEFGSVLLARNQRRLSAATRILSVRSSKTGENFAEQTAQRVAVLHALSSFEFFDALAESCGSADQAARLLPGLVKKALGM